MVIKNRHRHLKRSSFLKPKVRPNLNNLNRDKQVLLCKAHPMYLIRMLPTPIRTRRHGHNITLKEVMTLLERFTLSRCLVLRIVNLSNLPDSHSHNLILNPSGKPRKEH